MAAQELNKTVLKNNTNLKLYFRFEDASGTTVSDSSGNTNTGTASRSAILPQSAGQFGNKATFDSASSDKITITDASSLKPTGNFSLGGWVKTSSSGALQFIMQTLSENPNIAGIRMYIDATGLVVLTSGNNAGTSGTVTTTGTSVNDGNWHLVIGTWDGSSLRVWIDGKMVLATSYATAPVYAGTNYVRVGCSNSTGTDGNFFNGDMDDIFLFNGTALSADQIKELYEGRSLVEWWPQSGLVGLWHMNGNWNDFSGNNYHLTPTNSPTFGNGLFGQAGRFVAASSQYATIVNASCPNLEISGSQTWMCWVYQTTVTSYQTPMGKTNAGNTIAKSLLVSADPGNAVYFTLTGLTTNSQVGGGTVFSTNTWHHICGVYDSSATKLSLYIDGNLANSVTASGSATASGGDFSIGRGGSFSLYENGIVEEAAIFNRALSANEIRRYYARAKGRFDSSH